MLEDWLEKKKREKKERKGTEKKGGEKVKKLPEKRADVVAGESLED